ncbi:MAG: L-threonylcarbamoyladenylate synthase [Candidatus Magasanikbacteria bacterium]
MNIISQNNLNVEQIVKELKNGATIVYPTETCYGLGCDAYNIEALNKIFQIKNRQKNKSVLVVVPDLAMILPDIEWNPTLQKLADKYWPGPLTLVVKIKNNCHLPAGVINEDGTIAFRVTDHYLATEISRQLNSPLVSTSANISEMDSPYDVESILKMFENSKVKPDLVIDAGTLPYQIPSTIVRFFEGKLEVLRQGKVVVDSFV